MGDYWTDIIAYLKTAPVIKEWLEKDGETEGLKTLTDEDLMNWSGALQYKGFSIINIITLIKKSHDDYMNSNSGSVQEFPISFIAGGVQKQFKYSNLEKLSKDIQMLITLFMVRGNNFDKIKDKSLGNMSDLINCLIEKLSIDTEQHAPNTSLDPNLITLPRICACFPVIACNIQEKAVAKTVCTLQDLGIEGAVSSVILTPFFTSCIPRSSIVVGESNMHILFFIVHIVVDDVLHRKKHDFTDLQTMLQYYQASYDSPAVPQKSRLAYCRVKGLLIEGSNRFIGPLTTAQQTAVDVITSLRPNDKYLRSTIEALKKLR